MNKIFLLILAMIQLSISQAWPPVTNFTYYWNPQAGDTVTFAKWDANNDSVRAATGRIITELNSNVVHFNQGTANHDSVVHYVRIDTIAGSPTCDSLTTDSLRSRTINADRIDVDSIFVNGLATLISSGSFTCSLMMNTGYQTSAPAYYVKLGSFVNLVIGEMNCSIQLGTYGYAGLKGIPDEIMPGTANFIYIPNPVGNFALIDSSETVTHSGWLDPYTVGYPFDADLVFSHTFNTGDVTAATNGWVSKMYLTYNVY